MWGPKLTDSQAFLLRECWERKEELACSIPSSGMELPGLLVPKQPPWSPGHGGSSLSLSQFISQCDALREGLRGSSRW